MRQRRGLLVGAMSAVCMVSPVIAAPLLNGSFETGDFTAWTATGNVSVENNTGNVYDGTNNNGYSAGTSDGNFAAVFNNDAGTDSNVDGVVAQTFDTVPGLQYNVTFDYGLYGSGDSGTAGVLSVMAVDALTNSTLSGPTVYSDTTQTPYALTSANQAYILDNNFSFVAASTSTTLSFTDQSTDVNFADTPLDNVRVSAVPEPASLSLLALGGLLGLRRPRKSAATAV